MLLTVSSSPAAMEVTALPTRTPYMMTSSPMARLRVANLCFAGTLFGRAYSWPPNSTGSPAFKSVRAIKTLSRESSWRTERCIAGLGSPSSPVIVKHSSSCFRPTKGFARFLMTHESPKPLRVSAEHALVAIRWLVEQVGLCDFNRSRIRCCHEADGPVGANHEPIRSERCKGDVEKRDYLAGFPMSPVGFSDQARKLARYVREFGQPFDAFGPGIDCAALDRRLGKMIEDKALAWEPLHKL